MDDIAIRFTGVSKIYKLYSSSRRRLLGIFFKRVPHKVKKAVVDMNLTIRRGESVAVLGRNGAGKSTLLKMITGVTFPTDGEIEVNGIVSALLELTSGFDQEFTGRENIYLKGRILGLRDEEIAKLEPEIVEFAELEEYIDQPVRTYSSGMKARLGFSICVNIHPEILIVDEALSVGDRAFRDKCIKDQGHHAGRHHDAVRHACGRDGAGVLQARCRHEGRAHRVRRRHRCGDRILQYEILKARVEDGRL